LALLRPVLICQAVDQDDPVNATLVRWIRSLARDPSVRSVRVLSLRVGRFDLPQNVVVLDLGVGRLRRLLRFYAQVVLAIRRREADFFLVLQSGPYPGLLFPIKLLTGRRVYQWYTHTHVGWLMIFYARWCDDLVFTATPSSFPVALPNVRVIGHGIDTQLFRPLPRDRPAVADLIVVGRLTRVKRLDGLFYALAACRDSTGRVWTLDLCGPELDGDRQYRATLDDLVSRLHLAGSVRFLGPVLQDEMRTLLGCHKVAVSFSDGGLDKAIAEAMACGRPVLSTNACFAELLPDDLRELLVLDHDDVTAQARGITRVLELDEVAQRSIGERLRGIVTEHHSLDQFWAKILSEISGAGPGSVRAQRLRRGARA
jgi:glycosyltransferase involved in cell wall biosynthesis